MSPSPVPLDDWSAQLLVLSTETLVRDIPESWLECDVSGLTAETVASPAVVDGT